MGRHARRSAGSVVRRAGIPLVTVGLGLVHLGGVSAFAEPSVPLAPAAPSGEAPTADTPAPSPCEKTVKACVRLSTKEAWVTDGNGVVLRGPVQASHGGKGLETPVGSFTVLRKDAQHVSQEQPGVAMPYSVFFDDHGRALHGGDPTHPSAGCVHLADENAKFFFDHLQVGDSVQILP